MMSLSFHSSGQTTFTYMSPKSDKDVRNNYDVDLFRLALEMTIKSHGPYRLIISPLMNHKRAFASLETSGLTNFFVKQSISKSALDKYGAVKFPVDLGIVGYRVFFVSPNAKPSFQKVTT
ncbi:MAG: hypothetical protein MJK13_17390, partial [Pseudomonadales bacterium]|nr:hypothetical protein [Pseudomonadales bacterium]